jgi:hypothetical protein
MRLGRGSASPRSASAKELCLAIATYAAAGDLAHSRDVGCEQLAIDTHFTPLVHDHGGLVSRQLFEPPLNECGFPRTEKTGNDSDWNWSEGHADERSSSVETSLSLLRTGSGDMRFGTLRACRAYPIKSFPPLIDGLLSADPKHRRLAISAMSDHEPTTRVGTRHVLGHVDGIVYSHCRKSDTKTCDPSTRRDSSLAAYTKWVQFVAHAAASLERQRAIARATCSTFRKAAATRSTPVISQSMRVRTRSSTRWPARSTLRRMRRPCQLFWRGVALRRALGIQHC